MAQYDVIIVGAGPAGIFTALELKRKAPEKTVLLVDEGLTIDRRNCPARKTGRCVHCQPCNIMSGWSGAGAFSDGKLSLSEEVGGNIVEYMSREEARERTPSTQPSALPTRSTASTTSGWRRSTTSAAATIST